MKKIAYSIACALMVLCSCCAWGKGADNDKGMIVGAYLMGVRNELPDVNLVTHINYAFGQVNETFDGGEVAGRGRVESSGWTEEG